MKNCQAKKESPRLGKSHPNGDKLPNLGALLGSIPLKCKQANIPTLLQIKQAGASRPKWYFYIKAEILQQSRKPSGRKYKFIVIALLLTNCYMTEYYLFPITNTILKQYIIFRTSGIFSLTVFGLLAEYFGLTVSTFWAYWFRTLRSRPKSSKRKYVQKKRFEECHINLSTQRGN